MDFEIVSDGESSVFELLSEKDGEKKDTVREREAVDESVLEWETEDESEGDLDLVPSLVLTEGVARELDSDSDDDVVAVDDLD